MSALAYDEVAAEVAAARGNHRTPLVKRAAIYNRISKARPQRGLTAEQDPETLAGVKRQEKLARRLIATHSDWELSGIYTDNDVSAGKKKRGRTKIRKEFQALLNDIAAGVIDVVVLQHPDRLLREPTELEALIDLVQKRGVIVDTVETGDIDLRTSTGRMQARLLCTVAKNELERTSERVIATLEDLREKGRDRGGVEPYGHRAVWPPPADGVRGKRQLVIDPVEAELVREAAKRILLGNESVHSIITDWNRRGIKPRLGKEWKDTSLVGILTRASIAGLRGKTEYDDDGHRKRLDTIVGKAQWDGILSVDDLMKLRRKLIDPARAVFRKPPQLLLTGELSVCGRCEAHFKGHRNTMRCMGCEMSISRLETEAFVVEGFLERVDGGAIAAVMHKVDDDDTISKLVAVEARLKDMAARYARQEIDMAFVMDARPEMVRQQKALQATLDAQRRIMSLADIPDPLRPAWHELPVQRQRALLLLLMHHVVIKPVVKWGSNKFDTDRVSVNWSEVK